MRDERNKQVRDLAITGVGSPKRYKARKRLGQDEVRVGGEHRRLITIGYRRRLQRVGIIIQYRRHKYVTTTNGRELRQKNP